MRWLPIVLIAGTAHATELPTRADVVAAIAAQKSRLFRDPDSLKSSMAGRFLWISGWPAVCFETNAKNAFGGYQGARQYLAMIRNGQVELMAGKFTDQECGPWEPAPELDGR